MAEEATAAMANVALVEDDAGAEDFSAGRVGVAPPIDTGMTLDERYELCRSVGEECIQEAELRNLLSYSMNQVDRPSRYRGPTVDDGKYTIVGEPMPEDGEGGAAQDRRFTDGKKRIGGRAVLINETAAPEPEATGDEATPEAQE